MGSSQVQGMAWEWGGILFIKPKPIGMGGETQLSEIQVILQLRH